MIGKPKTKEEVNLICESLKYKLLKTYIIDKKRRRVIIKDKSGYISDICYSNLVKNQVRMFHKSNPYVLKNISLWLKINNKNFRLCKNNEYNGAEEKIKLYCFKCKDYFYMPWAQIQGGQNCAVCSGHQIGRYNNLKYLFPKLVKEWIKSKNNKNPKNVTKSSPESVYWKCSKCSHGWWAKVSDRTDGHGCPACAGKIVTDKNRLSIRFLNIALEWHPTKNGNLTPYDVSYGTNKKVWWLCSKGEHEWKTGIDSRTNMKSGCPKCNESKGEKRISEFLLKNNIKFIPQYKLNNCKGIRNKLPFDFYLPDYNLLIEYDGILHFIDKFNSLKEFEDTQRNDKIKTQYCKNNSLPLLRIKYTNFKNIEKILTNYLNIERRVELSQPQLPH